MKGWSFSMIDLMHKLLTYEPYDYEFNAPSAASAVVLGHTSNGNMDWKTEDGTKLKDL